MANISAEIESFRSAVYGEEVRGSMIALAEKINTEVENNTEKADVAAGNANTAASNANNAAASASEAVSKAGNAANTAEVAAADANAARDEILERLENGELKGEKGDPGEQGAQGESGVMAVTSGMFSLYLDPATGNLYAEYPDDGAPPAFEYDPVSGNLYYITDEGGNA